MQFRNFTRLVIISEKSEVTRDHVKLIGTRLIFYIWNGHEANGHEVNDHEVYGHEVYVHEVYGHEVNVKIPLKYSLLHRFCFSKMLC